MALVDCNVHRLLEANPIDEEGLKVRFNSVLGSLLASLPHIRVCTGIDECEAICQFLYNGTVDCGYLHSPNTKSILEFAKQSPFGFGEETVMNLSIRNGKELTAQELTITNVDLLLAQIVPQVQRKLFPLSADLECRFNKMAIYETDGHFDFHMDTTHGDDHHATLLIGVASKHKGGNLIFQHDGITIDNFQLDRITSDELHWAAFYTDVKHKVEPVVSGVRIVLQFDVIVKPQGSIDSKRWKDNNVEHLFDNYLTDDGAPYGSTEMSLRSDLFDRIDHEVSSIFSKLPKNHFLAIPLYHKYRCQALRPEFLKRADIELLRQILKANLYDVALSPIVMTVESGYQTSPPSENTSYLVHVADPITTTYIGLNVTGEIIVQVAHSSSNCGFSQGVYFSTKNEAAFFLEADDHIEYTGNDAIEVRFKYFLGALLIKLK